MSARARKKRSAHRFLLTGATCCALGKYFPITTFRRLIAHTQLTFILFHSGLAFALLRSGVRPHRGAVDRIDGGVDGDYTLDVVALEGGFSDGGGGGPEGAAMRLNQISAVTSLASRPMNPASRVIHLA